MCFDPPCATISSSTTQSAIYHYTMSSISRRVFDDEFSICHPKHGDSVFDAFDMLLKQETGVSRDLFQKTLSLHLNDTCEVSEYNACESQIHVLCNSFQIDVYLAENNGKDVRFQLFQSTPDLNSFASFYGVIFNNNGKYSVLRLRNLHQYDLYPNSKYAFPFEVTNADKLPFISKKSQSPECLVEELQQLASLIKSHSVCLNQHPTDNDNLERMKNFDLRMLREMRFEIQNYINLMVYRIVGESRVIASPYMNALNQSRTRLSKSQAETRQAFKTFKETQDKNTEVEQQQLIQSLHDEQRELKDEIQCDQNALQVYVDHVTKALKVNPFTVKPCETTDEDLLSDSVTKYCDVQRDVFLFRTKKTKINVNLPDIAKVVPNPVQDITDFCAQSHSPESYNNDTREPSSRDTLTVDQKVVLRADLRNWCNTVNFWQQPAVHFQGVDDNITKKLVSTTHDFIRKIDDCEYDQITDSMLFDVQQLKLHYESARDKPNLRKRKKKKNVRYDES